MIIIFKLIDFSFILILKIMKLKYVIKFLLKYSSLIKIKIIKINFEIYEIKYSLKFFSLMKLF